MIKYFACNYVLVFPSVNVALHVSYDCYLYPPVDRAAQGLGVALEGINRPTVAADVSARLSALGRIRCLSFLAACIAVWGGEKGQYLEPGSTKAMRANG